MILCAKRKRFKSHCLPQKFFDTSSFFCFGKMYLVYFHRNNRRLRRVLLCFYSAIFKLTSVKFQTFAFNLRMVRLARQNFDISLRLMSSIIVPNFEAIDYVPLALRPENRIKNFAYTALSSKNDLSTAKK